MKTYLSKYIRQFCVVVGILLVCIGFFIVKNQAANQKKEFYVYADDDDSLYVITNLNKEAEPIQLSDDFLSQEIDSEDVVISSNGRYIAFIEKEDASVRNTLYLWDCERKEEPVEVDEDVKWVEVLDNGRVLYTQVIIERADENDKEEVSGHRLKYFDGEENYRLDRGKNISAVINNEQTYAYYVQDDENGRTSLYRLNLSDAMETECLGENIEFMPRESTLNIKVDNEAGDKTFIDLMKQDVIVYTEYRDEENKKADIFAVLPGKSPEKLVRNVDPGVLGVSWDGEGVSFYYTVDRGNDVSLYELVDDPYAEEDETFLRSWSPDRDQGFSSVWDGSWVDNYERWKKAQSRDELRQALKNQMYHNRQANVFYYDHGQTVQIGEAPLDGVAISWPYYNFILYRDALDISSNTPGLASIDVIETAGDVYSYIPENRNPIYVALNGKNIECNMETNLNFIWRTYGFGEDELALLVADGETIVMDCYVTDNERLRRKEAIENQTIGEGISASAYVVQDKENTEKLYFFNDVTFETAQDGESHIYLGTLQCLTDGRCKEIEGDVNSIIFTKEYGEDMLLLLTDGEFGNSNEIYYTLSYLSEGKKQIIARDVISFDVLNDGRIIYRCDGDEVYLWDEGETERIRRNVLQGWLWPSVEKFELKADRL